MRPSQTQSTGQLRKCTLILLAVVLVGAIGMQVDAAKKMKPEQLVALHLDSIGTAEAREQVDSIVILGEAAVIPKVGGSGRIEGTSRLISTGAMSLIEMKFQNVNYPHERLIFDGEKVEAAHLKPGRRSPLGEFLYTQNMPLKEGLLGGVLTQDWPFYDIASSNPKLKYKGLRKMDGTKYHELEYKQRKGRSDLRTRLFFEQETYRHVISRYQMSISARMGGRPEDSSQQQEERFTLMEWYSDFREESGLTLPHSYRMEYTREGQRTMIIDYEMSFSDYKINQEFDERLFKPETTTR